MAYLADVNVLVALLHARHIASSSANAWLDRQEEPRSIALCRVAQMGTLRLLTNPAWLAGDVLTARQVWDGWDLMCSDGRFYEAPEPAGIEDAWRALTSPLPLGQQADTDAYLAAFAIAGGYRFVTFDLGFRKFEDLHATILDARDST